MVSTENLFSQSSLEFLLFFSSEACGAAINLASYKEHAVECKMKLAKVKKKKKR